jgi:hypothetical protein
MKICPFGLCGQPVNRISSSSSSARFVDKRGCAMDVPHYPPTGFPSPAEEWIEPSLNVHDLLIFHPSTTFFMRVNGDAMVGMGIMAQEIWVSVIFRAVRCNF